MKKILFLGMAIFIAVSSFNISFANETCDQITKSDEKSIKDVVETFVKTDFRYNGGDNNFNTIESDQFKQYLKARNDLKDFNNQKQDYEPFNDTFTFDYENISKNSDNVIVKVNVRDEFSYYLEGELTDDASTSDTYVIYLTSINDLWKVSSATIDTDVDLIDNVFDVNKELNSENLTTVKSVNTNLNNTNLNKMLNYIIQLKERLNHDIDDNTKVSTKNIPRSANKSASISNEKRNLIYKYAYIYREGNRNPNYLSFDADCANYASQALRYAGGQTGSSYVMDGEKRTWSLTPDSFHVKKTYGDAWAQANYLRGFIVRNEGGSKGPGGHAISYGSSLEKGDLTFLYHNGWKRWFHTYIVVGPGSNFKIASHTANKWMIPIDTAAPHAMYDRSYVHLTSLN